MNWRAIRAIARKDLKVVMQNKGVSIPMIVIPALFMVLMPALAAFVPALGACPARRCLRSRYIEQMPAGLQSQLAGLNEAQTMVTLLLVYMLAPMYLILPLMVSSVIAADSFAGEKERKSLEALLYTPTTDLELLLAKMLGAWLPALAVSWAGFLVYGLVANTGCLVHHGPDLLPQSHVGHPGPVGGARSGRAGPGHNGALLGQSADIPGSVSNGRHGRVAGTGPGDRPGHGRDVSEHLAGCCAWRGYLGC